MSLQSEIDRREISEVLHFTTNRGLLGSIHSKSLLSRPLLKDNQYLRYVLKLNSSIRPEEAAFFDKSQDWIRFVNLSISEVNKRFLDVSKKWHQNADMWWCILSFDSQIMTHDNVWFTTTNNGYDDCKRGQNEQGFEALFVSEILRKANGYYGPWNVTRGKRADNLPTCEQAEVLYPEQLSLDYLRRIYVEDDNHHDIVVGWLTDNGYDGVEVLVQPQKFKGQPN